MDAWDILPPFCVLKKVGGRTSSEQLLSKCVLISRSGTSLEHTGLKCHHELEKGSNKKEHTK